VTGHGFDTELKRLLTRLQQKQKQYRNTEGGFWVSEVESGAGNDALNATYPADTFQTAHLVTDGAANGIHRYSLATTLDDLSATGQPEI